MLESDFEMAAAKNNTSSDSDSRNDRSVVNILFVDEDEILFNTQSLRTNFNLMSRDSTMKNQINRHLTRARRRKWK